MLRVLHSVSNMDRAGIETMLMNYYRHVDRSRVQFDFLCNKEKPGDYDGEILALGGRVFRSPGLNPLKRAQYMRYMAALLSDNPDIGILHAHNEAMAEYALEGAKRAGLPVRIFHSHNTRIELNLKWPLKMLCKQFLKYNYTDMWACGRDAGAYYFGTENVRLGKVRILRNAIELRRFAYSPEARSLLRARHGLEGRFVVGHVGRFNVQKNHRFLLESFAEVYRQDPEARLALLGEGELRKDIEALARKLNISAAVLFLGNVDNANQWYSAMDVFAMPSRFEGLPVVGVEAQANGLKCLFSEAVSREANVGGGGEFLPLNAERWARRLLELRGEGRHPEYAQAIRANGYDVEIEAVKLQALYGEMSARK